MTPKRIYKLSERYYSRIKFFADLVTGVYTVDVSKSRKAFSYAQDQLKTSAGFTTFDGEASLADTNIENKANTNSGEQVLIKGVAIEVMPAGTHIAAAGGAPVLYLPDFRLVSAIFSLCSVELSLNAGKNPIRLGVANMIPGAGGLKGWGIDTAGPLDAGGNTLARPHQVNGEAVHANFYPVPEGITWKKQGDKDGSLQVLVTPQRDIIIPAGASTPDQIMCELMVHVIGMVKGDASEVY